MTRDDLLRALLAERFGQPTPPPPQRVAGPSALWAVIHELDQTADEEQEAS